MLKFIILWTHFLLFDSASNHGFPKPIEGGLPPEKNGKGEDRDQADRKHH